MPEEKLRELGLKLPSPPEPKGSYVPCTVAGSLVFVSGQLPVKDGELLNPGQVDTEISLKEAGDAARACVLNGLAALRDKAGGLDKIEKVVRVNGYVASSGSFTRQPEVLDAASDLLYEIFGEKGRHTRVAVGVKQLPLGACVELDFIFALKEGS